MTATKYTYGIHNIYASLYSYVHGHMYEGWNFNSGNYLFTTDTK